MLTRDEIRSGRNIAERDALDDMIDTIKAAHEADRELLAKAEELLLRHEDYLDKIHAIKKEKYGDDEEFRHWAKSRALHMAGEIKAYFADKGKGEDNGPVSDPKDPA